MKTVRSIIAALVLTLAPLAGAMGDSLRDSSQVDIAPATEGPAIDASRPRRATAQRPKIELPPQGRRTSSATPDVPSTTARLDPAPTPPPAPVPALQRDQGLGISLGTDDSQVPPLLRPNEANGFAGIIQYRKSLP
ncbi:hypothetical protein [Zavarzinia sp.]|uniref:hypothetical protein n=1 Tax=Zavarzinia sp. TaxID=2027920 RepID=UPI003562CEB3